MAQASAIQACALFSLIFTVYRYLSLLFLYPISDERNIRNNISLHLNPSLFCLVTNIVPYKDHFRVMNIIIIIFNCIEVYSRSSIISRVTAIQTSASIKTLDGSVERS